MVYTQHYCAKCGSEQIRRNGSKNGQSKYQCTACRYQGLFVPAAVRKAAQYAQVDALLVERNLQRSIARHRRSADDDCQAAKKKRRSLAAAASKKGPA